MTKQELLYFYYELEMSTRDIGKIINKNNIKSIDDALVCDFLWDIENGVTLCQKCHEETENYRGCSVNNPIDKKEY